MTMAMKDGFQSSCKAMANARSMIARQVLSAIKNAWWSSLLRKRVHTCSLYCEGRIATEAVIPETSWMSSGTSSRRIRTGTRCGKRIQSNVGSIWGTRYDDALGIGDVRGIDRVTDAVHDALQLGVRVAHQGDDRATSPLDVFQLGLLKIAVHPEGTAVDERRDGDAGKPNCPSLTSRLVMYPSNGAFIEVQLNLSRALPRVGPWLPGCARWRRRARRGWLFAWSRLAFEEASAASASLREARALSTAAWYLQERRGFLLGVLHRPRLLTGETCRAAGFRPGVGQGRLLLLDHGPRGNHAGFAFQDHGCGRLHRRLPARQRLPWPVPAGPVPCQRPVDNELGSILKSNSPLRTN